MNKNTVDSHIGSALRQIRVARGMTLGRLAEATCVPDEMLENYEAGRLRPTPGHFRKIGVALQTDPTSLFTSAMNTIDRKSTDINRENGSNLIKIESQVLPDPVDRILSLLTSINQSPDKEALSSVLSMITMLGLRELLKLSRNHSSLMTEEIKSPRHILLVDDDRDVLLITGRLLRQAGFKVTATSSGDEALLLLAKDKSFSAVITDFAMPGLTGESLIELARELVPSMPAVIITGYAAGLGTRAIPAGVTTLAKPFTGARLVNCLEDLLSLGVNEDSRALSASVT